MEDRGEGLEGRQGSSVLFLERIVFEQECMEVELVAKKVQAGALPFKSLDTPFHWFFFTSGTPSLRVLEACLESLSC